MRICLPKTRRFRVYLYVLAFALIFLAADLLLVRIGRHITIGYNTTRITGPLFPDGRPNYIQALDDQFSAGVTPDNNAAPLLLAATGPQYVPADALPDLYKRLSMAPLPATGDYFVTYQTYLKRQGPLSDKETSLTIDEQDAATGRPWQKKDHPHLAEWLNAMAKPLALVRQAAGRSRYFFPLMPSPVNPESLRDTRLPSLGSILALSETLCARAMLHAGEKDFQDARADLLGDHALARLIAQDPSAIVFLVGRRMDEDALAAERGLAASETLTPPRARQLIEDLDGLAAFPDAGKSIDTMERYIMLDQVVTAARKGPAEVMDRYPGTDDPPTQLEKVLLDLTPASFNAALRLGNRLIDAQVTAFKGPTFADRRAKSVAAERTTEHLSQSVNHQWLMNPASAILAQNLSSLDNVQTLADQRRMNMDLTRIALALGAYHADHGAYPATLSALAPAYLPAIPEDLFIDKPLHYRTTPGGYLLYAVGRNMVDDHGHNREHEDRANPNGDDVTVLVGEFPGKFKSETRP